MIAEPWLKYLYFIFDLSNQILKRRVFFPGLFVFFVEVLSVKIKKPNWLLSCYVYKYGGEILY